MPPPPPKAPKSDGASFASADSAFSVQRRRRKQENSGRNSSSNVISVSNGNINGTSNINAKSNTAESNRKRSIVGSASSKQRKWFRGDRKKLISNSLIIFTILCAWISIVRYEFITLSNFQNESGGRSSSSNSSSSTSRSIGIGRSRNNEYDFIFCRAGSSSFQNETAHKNGSVPPKSNSQTKPVFLWGIPSTTSSFEIGRRDLLRKTYLDFFKQIKGDESYQAVANNVSTATATNNATHYLPLNTICSFHDWTCDAKIRADCKMIYVFFVGGHESFQETTTTTNTGNHPPPKPPILLNESITDFRDMLLKPNTASEKGFDFHEPGTVYLDIRENQFDGKMTTWFKFASLVAKEYNSEATLTNANTNTNSPFPKIEYVFKVDSDLILLTPHFFRWFDDVHGEQQRLQGIRQPQQPKINPHSAAQQVQPLVVSRVYGGIEFPASNCVVNFTLDHPCPLPLSGPSYMSGELNFVSVDLATYIASDDCPRDKWTIPHEDVSLSNYVYTYATNQAYHKREELEEIVISSKSHNSFNNKDRPIHVVSVNTSRILLLPNMRASWETVSIRENPDILRSGELLWGHSIKRGNHSQYLYWKKDKKYFSFWKLFYRIYRSTGNMTKAGHRRKKNVGAVPKTSGEQQKDNDEKPSIFLSKLRKRREQKGEDREKTLGRILWETKHLQAF